MRQAEERLAALQSVAAALAASNTVEGAVRVLFDEALRALGAASGALWVLDDSGETLRWRGGAGVDASIPSSRDGVPMTPGLPVVDVVRTRAAMTFGSLAIGFPTEHDFEDGELRHLGALADQLAIALTAPGSSPPRPTLGACSSTSTQRTASSPGPSTDGGPARGQRARRATPC